MKWLQLQFSSHKVAWILAKVIVVVCTATAAPAAESAPPSARPAQMEKVRLSDDGKKFALTDSGKPFVPWGFNYLGSFGDIIEESWATDWARLEKDFREMRKLGVNVVRIHLQFGTYMKTRNEIDPGGNQTAPEDARSRSRYWPLPRSHGPELLPPETDPGLVRRAG